MDNLYAHWINNIQHNYQIWDHVNKIFSIVKNGYKILEKSGIYNSRNKYVKNMLKNSLRCNFFTVQTPPKKKKRKRKKKKKKETWTPKSKYLSTLLSIKPVRRGSKQVKIFKVTTSILSMRILTTSACTCITFSYLSVLATLINWHMSCQVIDLTDMHLHQWLGQNTYRMIRQPSHCIDGTFNIIPNPKVSYHLQVCSRTQKEEKRKKYQF